VTSEAALADLAGRHAMRVTGSVDTTGARLTNMAFTLRPTDSLICRRAVVLRWQRVSRSAHLFADSSSGLARLLARWPAVLLWKRMPTGTVWLWNGVHAAGCRPGGMWLKRGPLRSR